MTNHLHRKRIFSALIVMGLEEISPIEERSIYGGHNLIERGHTLWEKLKDDFHHNFERNLISFAILGSAVLGTFFLAKGHYSKPAQHHEKLFEDKPGSIIKHNDKGPLINPHVREYDKVINNLKEQCQPYLNPLHEANGNVNDLKALLQLPEILKANHEEINNLKNDIAQTTTSYENLKKEVNDKDRLVAKCKPYLNLPHEVNGEANVLNTLLQIPETLKAQGQEIISLKSNISKTTALYERLKRDVNEKDELMDKCSLNFNSENMDTKGHIYSRGAYDSLRSKLLKSETEGKKLTEAFDKLKTRNNLILFELERTQDELHNAKKELFGLNNPIKKRRLSYP